MKNRVGLIIAGGGGKGAYFIGVWKALREYGIENNITDISGTSVGALNAVLFAQGNYEIAESIWLNISMNDILKFDIKKIITGIASLSISKALVSSMLPILIQGYGNSIFSRQGLLKIIEDNVDLNYISSSEKTIYAATYDIVNFQSEYFKINNEDNDNIKKILLASSALPIIFEPQEVNGKYYYDGGLRDNIPIKPLYDDDVRNFIVVHLSRDSLIEREKFKDSNIIEIVPNESQGDLFTGTLDFSKEGARKRIQQGYNDAVKMLKPIYEMGLVQAKIGKTLNKLKQDNCSFEVEKTKLLNQRQTLKDELNALLNDI